jgi:RecA/RadA recombinase
MTPKQNKKEIEEPKRDEKERRPRMTIDYTSLVDSILGSKEMKNYGIQVAKDAPQVDVTDMNNFVIMPDWFTEITALPGVPFKFITEFVGPPDSGKTTAGIQAIVSAQKCEYAVILIDTERKFNMDRFKKMGGDPNSLILIQETTIEENFHVLECSEKKLIDLYPDVKILVIYDSIATNVSLSEMGKTIIDNSTVGDKAKATKRGLQRQIPIIARNSVALVVINQQYSGPNLMSDRACGGKGLEYSKALSVAFKGIGKIVRTRNKVEVVAGTKTKVRTLKNHLMNVEYVTKELELEIVADNMSKPAPKKKKGEEEEVESVETSESET